MRIQAVKQGCFAIPRRVNRLCLSAGWIGSLPTHWLIRREGIQEPLRPMISLIHSGLHPLSAIDEGKRAGPTIATITERQKQIYNLEQLSRSGRSPQSSALATKGDRHQLARLPVLSQQTLIP